MFVTHDLSVRVSRRTQVVAGFAAHSKSTKRRFGFYWSIFGAFAIFGFAFIGCDHRQSTGSKSIWEDTFAKVYLNGGDGPVSVPAKRCSVAPFGSSQYPVLVFKLPSSGKVWGGSDLPYEFFIEGKTHIIGVYKFAGEIIGLGRNDSDMLDLPPTDTLDDVINALEASRHESPDRLNATRYVSVPEWSLVSGRYFEIEYFRNSPDHIYHLTRGSEKFTQQFVEEGSWVGCEVVEDLAKLEYLCHNTGRAGVWWINLFDVQLVQTTENGIVTYSNQSNIAR